MRVRDGLGLLWVVPFGLAGAIWVRSGWVMDEVSAVDEGGVLRAAISYRGALHLVRAANNSTRRPVGWDTHGVPPAATWGDLYPPTDEDWICLGAAKFSSAPKRRGASPTAPPPPPRRMPLAPWIFTRPYAALAVPYWLAVLLTAPPAAASVTRALRRRSRRRRGLCPRCGYDVRASSERCPECGAAVSFARKNKPSAGA